MQKKLWSHWKSQRDYAKEKQTRAGMLEKPAELCRTDCTFQEKRDRGVVRQGSDYCDGCYI